MNPVDKNIPGAQQKTPNDPAPGQRDKQDQKISHFIAQSALPPSPSVHPIHRINPSGEGVPPPDGERVPHPLPILSPEAALNQLAQYGFLADIKNLLQIYYNKNWNNRDIDNAIKKAEMNGHDATAIYLRTYFNREKPNSECTIL